MELRGSRVVLRPFRLEDYDAWRSVRLANLDWIDSWEPAGPPPDVRYSREEFARGISFADGLSRADRGYRFAVWEANDLRGQIALNEISRGAFQNAYVGYWVDGRHAGRGLMTDALRVVLGYAFDTLGLHRVQASIIPHNAPSIRVAEKVGMRLEGLAARYIQINGVWEDHRIYALTAEEWRARLPA
jgi:[ribosomal protein S5]-alanine N-acetyltransferase